MLVTLDVSKLLTSRFVKLLQPLNIQYIFVTFDVLKLLTSRNVKLSQFPNI